MRAISVIDIPVHLKESFNRYVEHGILTDDFLRAVLENNLMAAVGMADDDNIKIILHICRYVYNDMPAQCHGNKVNVNFWIAHRGLEGFIKKEVK